MMIKKGITVLMLCTGLCFGCKEAQAYALIDFLMAPEPTPVVDPPTAVPLTLVNVYHMMQEVYTQVEEALQYKMMMLNTTVDLGIANVQLSASQDFKNMVNGLIQQPKEIAGPYVSTSTQALALIQQQALTSTAGTFDDIQKYEEERDAARIERVVELLAEALVLKKGAKKLEENLKKFQGKYTGGNEDKNEALRENANVRIIYDYLLSLQQQVLAQRMQIGGSESEFRVTPLTQDLFPDEGKAK